MCAMTRKANLNCKIPTDLHKWFREYCYQFNPKITIQKKITEMIAQLRLEEEILKAPSQKAPIENPELPLQ